jgi:hypothetical protein
MITEYTIQANARAAGWRKALALGAAGLAGLAPMRAQAGEPAPAAPYTQTAQTSWEQADITPEQATTALNFFQDADQQPRVKSVNYDAQTDSFSWLGPTTGKPHSETRTKFKSRVWRPYQASLAMNFLQDQRGAIPIKNVDYDAQTDSYTWKGPTTNKRMSMRSAEFEDQILNPYLKAQQPEQAAQPSDIGTPGHQPRDFEPGIDPEASIKKLRAEIVAKWNKLPADIKAGIKARPDLQNLETAFNQAPSGPAKSQALQKVSDYLDSQAGGGDVGAVNGSTSITASIARAAAAAHPITSTNPKIRLEQALKQDEDFQTRMNRRQAEMQAAREQEEAREAEAERIRQAQAAQEQAEYEANVLAQTGRQEGWRAANSNPNLAPEELEEYAKANVGWRSITNWDAYFNAYREAYNERAPQALVQQKANEERLRQQQAEAQERLAKINSSRSDDSGAKQDSYQKGFQWGRYFVNTGSTTNGGPPIGVPTSVAKKLAPVYARYCNPPAADFPSFQQGFLDAIDQLQGLTPM